MSNNDRIFELELENIALRNQLEQARKRFESSVNTPSSGYKKLLLYHLDSLLERAVGRGYKIMHWSIFTLCFKLINGKELSKTINPRLLASIIMLMSSYFTLYFCWSAYVFQTKIPKAYVILNSNLETFSNSMFASLNGFVKKLIAESASASTFKKLKGAYETFEKVKSVYPLVQNSTVAKYLLNYVTKEYKEQLLELAPSLKAQSVSIFGYSLDNDMDTIVENLHNHFTPYISNKAFMDELINNIPEQLNSALALPAGEEKLMIGAPEEYELEEYELEEYKTDVKDETEYKAIDDTFPFPLNLIIPDNLQKILTLANPKNAFNTSKALVDVVKSFTSNTTELSSVIPDDRIESFGVDLYYNLDKLYRTTQTDTKRLINETLQEVSESGFRSSLGVVTTMTIQDETEWLPRLTYTVTYLEAIIAIIFVLGWIIIPLGTFASRRWRRRGNNVPQIEVLEQRIRNYRSLKNKVRRSRKLKRKGK